ncbi:unnamed protein product, partial [Larinioides sclopetarius]
EENITSSEVNLIALNLNNYDLYGNSDLWRWNENSDTLTYDIKSTSSKSSMLSNWNHQLQDYRQCDATVKHMVIGCCPDCKPGPYTYKYVVYNILEGENNKRSLFEKNIGECLLRYENSVLISPEKKTEKVGNVPVSNPLNRKLPCSELNGQDHFSGNSDFQAFRLHKNVFKKFNPRTLLMLPTPSYKNRIRRWEGAKKAGKSSEDLLGNGSREFLKKANSKEIEKETRDDGSPLIPLENKSSENLCSNLSSSMDWQSIFERTFKTENLKTRGAEGRLDLIKHTQLIKAPKNFPSKISALG